MKDPDVVGLPCTRTVKPNNVHVERNPRRDWLAAEGCAFLSGETPVNSLLYMIVQRL